MNILFLHTTDCHVWKDSLTVLKEVLKEVGVDEKVEEITVASQEEAERYKFLGSPTILIDGIDLDPKARNVTNYTVASCRSYVYDNKFYEYPPKKMIIESLKERR